MKKIGTLLLICFLTVSVQNSAFAQTDTGLPIKAGENSNDPNKGNLTGKITIQGLDPTKPKPVVFVSAIFNGVVFDRRQAFDNGSYLIPGIPRENITVLVEVNGIEAGRQSISPSIMGTIQMDFTVNMFGQNADSKSGVVSAKDLYSRSAENDKLFEKASAAAKDKKLDIAIGLFKEIVANDPKDFVTWTELGTLYFRDEKFSEAEKSYQKALDLKPDFMVAALNLSKVLLAQKQAEKVIPILTKAVEIDPKNVDALHYLGEAYLQTKQGNNSAILFYEALRLAPVEKAELHLRLAWLYNAKGYKDKAAEEYKQFLQKVPKYAEKEKLEKYIKENSPK